ncbi:tetratricopeptide repeat protein [Peredibacter sp. HCB2-198]|uniref:tetratricopeptide repeat protein n=1 Tax=Peredibacter sp. HCB2-198 TaxID=3383025 RepID=UPI0038B43C5C
MKYSLIPLASLLLVSSCSWYRDLERSLVEDDEKQMKRQSRTVPRAQYDQLLVKYEELSKKYEALKEKPPGSQDSLVDELQRTQSENFAQPSSNVETETVNVFPATSATAPATPSAPIQVPDDVESQLSLYRRGLALKASNPGEATKIFQQLENQAVPAVKVRAKFQIGELLLGRGQYDLALQVFEDIINKNAESGVVLDALKYAVICTEKLGVANKKDQYTSMLNDVFETRE